MPELDEHFQIELHIGQKVMVFMKWSALFEYIRVRSVDFEHNSLRLYLCGTLYPESGRQQEIGLPTPIATAKQIKVDDPFSE